MPRDYPWRVSWPAHSIVVHGSSVAEAQAKALQYLKAMNPFKVEPHQHESDSQADGHASDKRVPE